MASVPRRNSCPSHIDPGLSRSSFPIGEDKPSRDLTSWPLHWRARAVCFRQIVLRNRHSAPNINQKFYRLASSSIALNVMKNHAAHARATLERLAIGMWMLTGDGARTLRLTYDAIAVSAAASQIPLKAFFETDERRRPNGHPRIRISRRFSSFSMCAE